MFRVAIDQRHHQLLSRLGTKNAIQIMSGDRQVLVSPARTYEEHLHKARRQMDNHTKEKTDRRGFLEIGSAAALTTAGILLTGAATAQSSTTGLRRCVQRSSSGCKSEEARRWFHP
jgi:hypothetical protein